MATSLIGAGAQVLYNDGILPGNLGSGTLASATPKQLQTIASSNLALQNVDTLFGLNSSSGDSVDLSSTAQAALQADGISAYSNTPGEKVAGSGFSVIG